MNRRSRTLLRVLVRVPGCLALLSGLLLGAAPRSAAATPYGTAASAGPPATGRGAAVLTGTVTPGEAEVPLAENGDFVITVTNTGALAARNVRVLLNDGAAGNGVGSPDGRCLGRLDAASPADLWCELGEVAPRQSVTVAVHAYMFRCVWLDPNSTAPLLHAPAFYWRIGYTDDGRSRLVNEPTPRWSCSNSSVQADLDMAEAGKRP